MPGSTFVSEINNLIFVFLVFLFFLVYRHKNFLTFPQVLQMADPPIPFEIIWQYPGDCVATCPGAYHMVINLGNNTAEATNYTLPVFTDKFCGKPSTCNCFLREEIDSLRAKFKFQQPGRDEPEPLSQPSDGKFKNLSK
jgi:hypothetical protein